MSQKSDQVTVPSLRFPGSSLKKTAWRALFLLFALSLIMSHKAKASHFRFGLITATRISETSTTATYRLNVSLSWRLGTAPAAIPFSLSGGNTGSVSVSMTTVTDPTGTYDNSSGTATITLNKTHTLTKIEFTGFTKLTTISNNAGSYWDVYTFINTGASGSSPVSSLPAIINMPAGVSATTFSVPASDPDAGSTLTYGTPAFTGVLTGETEPSGFSIDATTGLMTFNTMGKTPGQVYNAMITITDNDSNLIELDFLINMVTVSAPPQFDYSVTPLNGSVYNILVGQNITFPIQATNPGSGTTVGLSVSGLPSYITTSAFSPAFPATGNPSLTNFSWTPAAPQLGNTVILNFIATNNFGIQTSSSVTINVVGQPAPTFLGNTPGEGTIRSILAGVPINDTISAQSSIGSNVSIVYAIIPAGAYTFPAVPTTGANPAQTIFTWTPLSSDFGINHLTFESEISTAPSIYATLHYDLIVDDLPVFSSSPVTTATGCVAYTYSVTATDANIPYGDTVDIVADGPLPYWLTLTPTGNGTAVLAGTPANSDIGTYIIILGAEDLYHHNYSPVEQIFTIVVTANVITGIPDICVGTATTLSDAIAGGTWSSSNTNAVVNTSTGIMTGTAGGTSIITYTLGAGCTTVTTATINALPSVAGISGASAACVGSTSTLTNSTAGGLWSSSDISVATIGSASGTYTGVTTGTSTISYIVTNGLGCVNSVTAVLAINPFFAIASYAGANGTISPSGTASICSGDNAPYTITANSGYHILDVIVDGSSVGATGSYIFTGVNASHTISASFAASCTPPAITCSGDTTQNADPGSCNGIVTYLAATATGTSPTITYSQNSGTSFPVGTTTVIATATNSCGTDNCIMKITVVDNENPTITAPGSLTVNADAGACSAAIVSLGTPTAADNCGVAGITNNAIPPYGIGTTVVTWTVTDIHGNTAVATQNVVVIDNQAPTITAPGNVTVNADAGACSAATVSLGTPTTADNCGVASVTNDAAPPYATGTTTVTWTVTDIHGNTATATQNVIVVDNQNPTITAPASVTVNADAGTCAAATVSLGTPITADNCGVASVTNNAIPPYAVGTTVVTWTVTDIHGNKSTASQNVTVTDNEKPIITAPGDVTVNADAGACSAAIVSLGTPATADNCGVASVANNATPPYAVGTTVVTWTVTDIHGNTATASQNVTVIDNQNPTIIVPQNIAIEGYCIPVAVSIGTPVTGDNCGVASVTNDAPSIFPVGTTIVTWTVTDIHGNITTATQTVIVSGSIALTAATVNVSCHGGSNGSITTSIIGGTPSYSYLWSTGATTSGISGIPAGTYSVTVTDAHECRAGGSYVITQPSALSLTAVVANVSCNGLNNGSITTNVTGGTAGYSYSWSTGSTSANLTALAPGTYSVTVTDAHGCTVTGSYTIIQPSSLALSAVTANAACHGGNGTVTTTLTGGTSPYGYLWSNGATTSNLTAVAGTYSVTVTDAGGCMVKGGAYTITQPVALSVTAAITNVSCYGVANGIINTTVTGGTPGYSYTWSNGSTAANPSGLAAGTYSLMVTDAKGCTLTAAYSVTQPAAISITAITTNVSCYGGSNGNINTTVTSGTGPYTYSWSNGSLAADPLGLSAGSYSVTVTDAHGCTIKGGTYTVTQPTAVVGSISVSPVYNVIGYGDAYTIYLVYGNQTDTLTASATGGTPGYTYSWAPIYGSTSTLSASPTATTTYSVTITDALGCTKTDTQTIVVKDIRCNGDGLGKDHTKPKRKCIYLCFDGHNVMVDSSDVATYLALGYKLDRCKGSHRSSNPDDNSETVGTEFAGDVIRVYPNPNEGVFSVEIPAVHKEAEIQISDITGRIIQTRTISGNNGEPVQFSLGSIAQGMYFVKVRTGDKIYINKLIKK